jgi:hypothetical protein
VPPIEHSCQSSGDNSHHLKESSVTPSDSPSLQAWHTADARRTPFSSPSLSKTLTSKSCGSSSQARVSDGHALCWLGVERSHGRTGGPPIQRTRFLRTPFRPACRESFSQLSRILEKTSSLVRCFERIHDNMKSSLVRCFGRVLCERPSDMRCFGRVHCGRPSDLRRQCDTR